MQSPCFTVWPKTVVILCYGSDYRYIVLSLLLLACKPPSEFQTMTVYFSAEVNLKRIDCIINTKYFI